MNKYLRFTVYLLTFFILIVAALLPSRLIKINKISCQSQYGNCDQNIDAEIQKYRGQNLSFASKNTQKTLSNHILVKNYTVRYQFPNELKISLIERTAKYSLASATKNQFLNIDSEGIALSLTDTTELPFVIIDSKLPYPGIKVTDQQKFALDLTYDLFLTFQIKETQLDSQSLVIELNPSLRVIFPLEGDRKALVGSLVLLYPRVQNQSEESIESLGLVDTIDLRFQNPVLKTR
jgi:cell division septal protein FtsQ